MSVAEPLPLGPDTESRAPVRWKADLSLALICLIWGATFVIVKNALVDVSTLLFLGLRFGIAALTLAIVFAAGGKSRAVFGPGPVIGGVLAGCCLFGGYFLQTEGLKYTTPGKSGFLTGFYIVLVPLLAAAVYRRAPRAIEWLGFALAGTGMALMTFTRDAFHINLGDALTIGCAFMYAAHILVLGRFAPRMTVERLTMLQMVTCATLGLATCWFLEPVMLNPRPVTLAVIVGMGIVATALTFSIQTWAQKFTTATRTALIFSLEPVFALATSVGVGAEDPTARSLAGAGCILAGILVVELKPTRGGSHP